MHAKLYSNLLILIHILKCCAEYKVKTIELDHVIDHDSPYFRDPGAIPFSYEVIEASNNRGFWLAFGKYETRDCVGTCIISPYAYEEFGRTVHDISVEEYFGEANAIDIRDKVGNNGNYELSTQDVKDWIDRNGIFSNNSIVLVNTGWEKGRYPDQKLYIGDDRGVTGNIFPGIAPEAMKMMLDYEKSHGIRIIAFGIDTPRLDVGNVELKNRNSARQVAALSKYSIANLRNLESLPPKGAKLVVLPIKIRNAPSTLTRVLARIPN